MDNDILRRLVVIHIEGSELLTADEQLLLNSLKERFQSPVQWKCMSSRTKPFFLDSMKLKLYQLECEGYLQSFLIRIIVVSESIKGENPPIDVLLKQLRIAHKLLYEGVQKEATVKASSNTLKLVLYCLIASIYEIRGYPRRSIKILRACQHLPVDEEQQGILSIIKALVSSYYGVEGLIFAMEECVSQPYSSVFELERRFLLAIIIPQICDIELTEDVVRRVTQHMGYPFTAEENKPASTFSHFWRLTAPIRNVPTAVLSLRAALSVAQLRVQRSAEAEQQLDLQVVRALETDPCNLDLLADAARYFFIRNQAHKSFWVYWVGQKNYRICAEGLLQSLSTLFPGSEAVDCDLLIQYFTPISSLGVLKGASLYLLAIDQRRALKMATWALRVQVEQWTLQRVPRRNWMDRPVMLCGQETKVGFLELMCCLADGSEGRDAAEEFLKVAWELVPHIASVLTSKERVDAVVRELQDLLQQVGLAKIFDPRPN